MLGEDIKASCSTRNNNQFNLPYPYQKNNIAKRLNPLCETLSHKKTVTYPFEYIAKKRGKCPFYSIGILNPYFLFSSSRTFMTSRTWASLDFKVAISASFSLSSTIRSIPFLPSTTGTPR
jgi:hypothetical protein